MIIVLSLLKTYINANAKNKIGTKIMDNNPKNILHGITLEKMITKLVEHYEWEELGTLINIKCFNYDPSIKSSLKFIRKENWARIKVEKLYIKTFLGDN